MRHITIIYNNRDTICSKMNKFSLADLTFFRFFKNLTRCYGLTAALRGRSLCGTCVVKTETTVFGLVDELPDIIGGVVQLIRSWERPAYHLNVLVGIIIAQCSSEQHWTSMVTAIRMVASVVHDRINMYDRADLKMIARIIGESPKHVPKDGPLALIQTFVDVCKVHKFEHGIVINGGGGGRGEMGPCVDADVYTDTESYHEMCAYLKSRGLGNIIRNLQVQIQPDKSDRPSRAFIDTLVEMYVRDVPTEYVNTFLKEVTCDITYFLKNLEDVPDKHNGVLYDAMDILV